MKYVEAIITQVVYSHAIVAVDDDGHIVEVEDIIEEDKRTDTEIHEHIKDIRGDF